MVRCTVIVFDDYKISSFEPITHTRCIADTPRGPMSLYQHISRALNVEVFFFLRPEVKPVYRKFWLKISDCRGVGGVFTPAELPESDVLLVNGRLVPQEEIMNSLSMLAEQEHGNIIALTPQLDIGFIRLSYDNARALLPLLTPPLDVEDMIPLEDVLEEVQIPQESLLDDLAQLVDFSLKTLPESEAEQASFLDGCEVGERVILQGNVHIGAGAILRGDCYIENSIIGRNCIVENSVIINSIVEDYSYVSGSVVQNSYVGRFTILRDSTVSPRDPEAGRVFIGDFLVIRRSTIAATLSKEVFKVIENVKTYRRPPRVVDISVKEYSEIGYPQEVLEHLRELLGRS